MDAERDCRARQSGDFDGGSTIIDGSKVFKWVRDPIHRSRFEDSQFEVSSAVLILCDFDIFIILSRGLVAG